MELARPESVADAVAALGNGAVALGGGTELVPLLNSRIVRADTLVELRKRRAEGHRRHDDRRRARRSASSRSTRRSRRRCARRAASPRRRSCAPTGTIGGNLLQATRCWYWRLKFPCRLHGGDRCHAREGEHREHAIFANDFCASAHPSDPAAALLALGATVRTDRRELPIAELYRLPTEDDRCDDDAGEGRADRRARRSAARRVRLPEGDGPAALVVRARRRRGRALRRRRALRPRRRRADPVVRRSTARRRCPERRTRRRSSTRSSGAPRATEQLQRGLIAETRGARPARPALAGCGGGRTRAHPRPTTTRRRRPRRAAKGGCTQATKHDRTTARSRTST